MNQIKILDVKINIISKNEVLDKIKNLLLSNTNEQHQLVTTNPEFIFEAQKDAEFKNIINNSWLSVADGYGIKLATKYLDLIKNKNSRILKFFIGLKIAWWGITRNDEKLNIIKEIITGADLIPEICKLVNNKIFLLGGYNNTSELTAENLKKQNPNLQINYSVFETHNIIEKINNFQTDILFVALNHPHAQKWINENLSKMPSVKLAIGVGGAFDYISGKIKRAPENLQSSYEWIYRLKKEPRRFKRIFNAVVRFSWLVFTNSLKNSTRISKITIINQN